VVAVIVSAVVQSIIVSVQGSHWNQVNVWKIVMTSYWNVVYMWCHRLIATVLDSKVIIITANNQQDWTQAEFSTLDVAVWIPYSFCAV
jgi:hypothetical protein